MHTKRKQRWHERKRRPTTHTHTRPPSRHTHARAHAHRMHGVVAATRGVRRLPDKKMTAIQRDWEGLSASLWCDAWV